MDLAMDDQLIKVAVIDDDEDDYALVRDLLQSIDTATYVVDWIPDFDEALEAIGQGRYDVFLLDYLLGEHDGLELLYKAVGLGSHPPIIFLTGQGNYRVDMEAMQAGAADYLVKGQLSSELVERSIRYSIAHKEIEDTLRKSEQKYRTLVETMNEGLGVQDEKGLLTYVNDRLCEMLGYTRDELIGRSVIDLFDRENLLTLMEEMERRKLGERTSYEVQLQTKDGRNIPTIVSSSPVFDEQGVFKGGVAAITDLRVQNKPRSGSEPSSQASQGSR